MHGNYDMYSHIRFRMKNYATQCEKIRLCDNYYECHIALCLLNGWKLHMKKKSEREKEINVDHTFSTDACLVFDLK
jgi:hypothetical protein